MTNHDFERELSRIYKEINKFSDLQWSARDTYEQVNCQAGRRKTRSKVSEHDLKESEDWKKNTDAQFGYGEITKVRVM